MAAKPKPKQELTFTLTADKVTKGAVRFVDEGAGDWPVNIYLRHAQVEALGLEAVEGAQITLTVESA